MAKATFEAVSREIEADAALDIHKAEEKASLATAAADKRMKECEQALSEMRQKMDRQKQDAEDRIRGLERDLASERQQVAIQKNALIVANTHVKGLETLLANRQITVETVTAILHQKYIDAESPPNQAQADAYNRLIRGE